MKSIHKKIYAGDFEPYTDFPLDGISGRDPALNLVYNYPNRNKESSVISWLSQSEIDTF